MPSQTMNHPRIVSRAEWLSARKQLLAKEEELIHHQDSVNAERRRLPMVRIDKNYTFEGPGGKAGLLDLFEGRRQLIVYHFMFSPEWDEGCPGCSLMADNIGHLSHLHARDTSLALVSRAPLDMIEPFKQRMGWTVPWYSSSDSDFNYDFHVTLDETVAPIEYNYDDKSTLEAKGESENLEGECPGVSVFLSVGGAVFHTYSAYARGVEPLVGTFQYLDLTVFGRQEDWEDSPEGWPQTPSCSWFRHHDRYGNDAGPDDFLETASTDR